MNNDMNIEQARFNMIEQQIRPWDVLDPRVLQLVANIHREDFMPEEYRQLAFVDMATPIGHGQMSLSPRLEARILQSLNVRPDDTVLEIGTGCAYLTALFARSAKSVTSIDIFSDFTTAAGKKLAKAGINNVNLVTGDAINGWPEYAPYDVIAVTGSVPELAYCFQEQLALNGRLFIIVGRSPVMEAQVITRINEQEFIHESVFETDIAALIGTRDYQHAFKF